MCDIFRSEQLARSGRNGNAIGHAYSGNLRKARGFTLIELMIAVVIVGVISAIAVSSYKSSIMKANRSAAKSALLDLAGREEKYYSLNNTYAPDSNNAATLGVQLYGTGSAVTFSINVPATGTTLYTIATPTVAAAVTNSTTNTPATFSITATPVGPQANDQCGSFTINSAGQQSVTGTGTCW